MPLSRAAAALCAIVLGGAVGYVAERIPMSPPLRSVLAANLAAFGGSVIGAVLLFLRSADEAGIGAVSFGVLGAVLGFTFFTVAALLLHVALGWLGSAISPGLVAHRPVVLGILAGVYGCLALLAGAPTAGIAVTGD